MYFKQNLKVSQRKTKGQNQPKALVKKKNMFLTEGKSKYEFTLNDSTQVMKYEEWQILLIWFHFHF